MGERKKSHGDLIRKIDELHRKRIVYPRLKIALISISIAIVLIGGGVVGGFFLFKNDNPVGTEEIVYNDTTISISDVDYGADHILTITLEANSTVFPEINATHAWLVPIDGFLAWRNTWESDLAFNSTVNDTSTSNSIYTSNSTLEYSILEFLSLNYELIVRLDTTDSQVFYLNSLS